MERSVAYLWSQTSVAGSSRRLRRRNAGNRAACDNMSVIAWQVRQLSQLHETQSVFEGGLGIFEAQGVTQCKGMYLNDL